MRSTPPVQIVNDLLARHVPEYRFPTSPVPFAVPNEDVWRDKRVRTWIEIFDKCDPVNDLGTILVADLQRAIFWLGRGSGQCHFFRDPLDSNKARSCPDRRQLTAPNRHC